MRMWNVNPKLLCRKHLLGEHVETHMFIGTLNKHKSLKGYINKGLVEVHTIVKRHNALANEMVERGYNHKSPIKLEVPLYNAGSISVQKNLLELKRRCIFCRERMKNV